MHKRLRGLVFASTVTGILVVGLLALNLALGRGWIGLRGYRMWAPVDLSKPWDFLGRVTIALLMLAIPTAHVAWLITALIWLARSTGSPQAGGMSDCPHCGGKVRTGWKACPHCGEKLKDAGSEERQEDAKC